jgi:hypothetical protein
MIFLPAGRFRTIPFPPGILAALRIAAAMRVPRVFFMIFVFFPLYTVIEGVSCFLFSGAAT